MLKYILKDHKYLYLIIATVIPLILQIFGINNQILRNLNKLNGQDISLPISIIMLITIWLSVIFVPYSIYLLKKLSLELDLSVYWDKNDNPFCPSCLKPLVFWGYVNSIPFFQCVKCKSEIVISSQFGKRFNLFEARDFRRIRKIKKPHNK